MSYNFKDQVILITGAGSGIGRATAIKLASLNATLALCDINYSSLEGTSKLCAGTPTSPYLSDVDVSSVKEVHSFIDETLTRFSRIDHVFNCAGVNPTSIPLEDTPDDYWDKLVGVNLKGVFNVTRGVIPHLKSGASFVNVSSISGIRPSAQQAVYCTTKYGLIGFSKCIALELGPRGIRTNVVCPGYIDTPTNAGIVKGGAAVESMAHGNALHRLGTPEEVADVVAFLFSGEARYMNGSVVEIDGGIKGNSNPPPGK
ncbi:short-chain dehydrogenase/reductase-like protein SDR [Bimuria novae-zelandiae CBS 107.79]|uniref:Short-chain dehydrogenase/reductase-like protein SDR n=1 Tax=Bimuria novae-zelandiae CBS 107.79 TaxID=1447943 RepID=A0A6A5V6D4_9PLEO|nr:short-chain dehydrogenase/reductase-like protein SDR [Bimuria novae-zelandiae CBS 107.79]